MSSSPSSSSDCGFSPSKKPLQLKNTMGKLPEDNDNLPHHSADALALPYHTGTSSSLSYEESQSHMPPRNRSRGRDVHIFSASDRSISIGGLTLGAGITNANLYAMVEIFVVFQGEYILRNEGYIIIEKNDSPLIPGNYYVDSHVPFDINNEVVLLRTTSSAQSGQRVQAFCDAVRLRDKRCVITGNEVFGAQIDEWDGFEAAHILPLAYEKHWKDHNFARWISIPPTRGGTINSVQNGMLLRCDIHQRFDDYKFSINPDDGYKIISFGINSAEIAGKYLDSRLLENPQRPPDELFRWHFRQAVLINMRGAGEPIFEHDFPPGSDIVGSILKGPKAAKRMEFELFNRLAAQFDLNE